MSRSKENSERSITARDARLSGSVNATRLRIASLFGSVEDRIRHLGRHSDAPEFRHHRIEQFDSAAPSIVTLRSPARPTEKRRLMRAEDQIP